MSRDEVWELDADELDVYLKALERIDADQKSARAKARRR